MKTLSEKKKILIENLDVNIDVDVINNINNQNTLKKAYDNFDNHYRNGVNKGHVIITKFDKHPGDIYSMTVKERFDEKEYVKFKAD